MGSVQRLIVFFFIQIIGIAFTLKWESGINKNLYCFPAPISALVFKHKMLLWKSEKLS